MKTEFDDMPDNYKGTWITTNFSCYLITGILYFIRMSIFLYK